jgi:hypothetical protein
MRHFQITFGAALLVAFGFSLQPAAAAVIDLAAGVQVERADLGTDGMSLGGAADAGLGGFFLVSPLEGASAAGGGGAAAIDPGSFATAPGGALDLSSAEVSALRAGLSFGRVPQGTLMTRKFRRLTSIVPEPSTGLLLLGGIVGLALRRRPR